MLVGHDRVTSQNVQPGTFKLNLSQVAEAQNRSVSTAREVKGNHLSGKAVDTFLQLDKRPSELVLVNAMMLPLDVCFKRSSRWQVQARVLIDVVNGRNDGSQLNLASKGVCSVSRGLRAYRACDVSFLHRRSSIFHLLNRDEEASCFNITNLENYPAYLIHLFTTAAASFRCANS